MSELLTVEDVARRCKVPESTIRRCVSSGRLRAVRIGRHIRFREKDLQTFLERSATCAEPEVEPVPEGKPFPPDDPFLELLGSVTGPQEAWVSSDKYRALYGNS
jgi:excisionase family DNA binding protein